MEESQKNIIDSLVESEKSFLKTLNFEIPFLLEKLFFKNNKETGFYAEDGHIKRLKFYNGSGLFRGLSQYSARLIPVFNEKIANLKYLQSLETNNLSLISLPESFGNLKNLQILKLTEQNLETLPESFGNLKNLQNFSINGRGFSSLPGKIESLPESFGNLKNLTELTIVSTFLHGLPESFENLNSLENLILPRNHLYSLPESFGNLKSLKNIDFHSNQISFLPKNFGNLNSLEVLNFSYNALQSISANFGNLKNLKNLNLEKNSIAFLPESFGNLKNLQWLNLRNNKLSYLPNNFKKFKKQPIIILIENPIRSLANIPINLIKKCAVNYSDLTSKGKNLYKSYINSMHEGRRDDRENNLELICEYYKKSPRKLAQQYAENPKSLNHDEKKRLIHEANHHDRKIIEEYLPLDDPVIRKISNRLKVDLPNSLPLL